MFRRKLISVLVPSAVALACLPQARGGVVAVSRASEISLQADVEDQSFDDTRSGNALGLFDDVLSFETGTPPDTNARGLMSQNTSVTFANGRLRGSGNLHADAFAQFNPEDVSGPAVIFGDSTLTVLFDIIDSPELLHADGDFAGVGFRGATGRMNLHEISDPNAPVTVFNNDNELDLSFQRDLTLQPGSYQLFVGVGAGSSGSSPGDPFSFGEQTTLDFAFSVGREGVVIPLPAAVWPGLATLVVAGAMALRARRQHR